MDGNGATQEVKPKFPGIEMVLGDTTYVIPSLNVAQARKYWPLIMEINEGVDVKNLGEKYEKIITIVHAALSRNYPNVSKEQLEEVIDMRNIRAVQLAIMGVSGLSTPGAEPVLEKPAAA